MSNPEHEREYWNPYLCGVLLGVVLFTSYLVTGHGLGASGGLARLVTAGLKQMAPGQVDTNGFFAGLGGGAKNPLSHWLLWEVLGVAIGGIVSARLAGRLRIGVQSGPRLQPRLARRRLFELPLDGIDGLRIGVGSVD